MYDEHEFFIENDVKRYSIGSTTDGLTTDPDGSLTLYVQHDDAGPDQRSNLAARPHQQLCLTMRPLRPQAPILDGSHRTARHPAGHLVTPGSYVCRISKLAASAHTKTRQSRRAESSAALSCYLPNPVVCASSPAFKTNTAAVLLARR